MSSDKCSDCQKEYLVKELNQVKDQWPNQPKYKMVCNQCYKKGKYELVGKFK